MQFSVPFVIFSMACFTTSIPFYICVSKSRRIFWFAYSLVFWGQVCLKESSIPWWSHYLLVGRRRVTSNNTLWKLLSWHDWHGTTQRFYSLSIGTLQQLGVREPKVLNGWYFVKLKLRMKVKSPDKVAKWDFWTDLPTLWLLSSSRHLSCQ